MSLPLITRPPLGGCGDPGMLIPFACLFDTSGQYLTGAAGAGTLVLWVKRAALGGTRPIIGGLSFVSDALNGSAGLFRDPASWMVIQANSLGTWVNHDLVAGGVASFGTIIGQGLGAYVAEARFYAGVDLAPGSDSYINAQGVPVARSYGGPQSAADWRMDFADPLDLGKDVSGNSNHFTATGLTADNQVTDTPTNNIPTLSPLWLASRGSPTLTGGNLGITASQGTSSDSVLPVPLEIPPTGKWAMRFKPISLYLGTDGWVGVLRFPGDYALKTSSNPYLVNGPADGVFYYARDGEIVPYQSSTGTAYGATWGNGDVLDVLVDREADELRFLLNGVDQGVAATGLGVEPLFFAFINGGGNGTWEVVNGNRGEAPPAGYGWLTVAALACPAILNPDDHFTIRLTTGGADVTDLPWDPTQHKTLVVSKRRDGGSDWQVVDTVRGAGRFWVPNDATYGFLTDTNGLSSFTSNGFTIGSRTAYQGARVDYIWRASPLAGFDIVGPIDHTAGASTTVTHRVGGAVDYAWVVSGNAGQDRRVFHRGMETGEWFPLNGTPAPSTDAGWFASTATDLTLGATMPTGTYYVYAWRQVPGFSWFGIYTGNGSADGPMLPMGFMPRLFIYKPDSVGGSGLGDIDRSPENTIDDFLSLSATAAEASGASYVIGDYVSNGLKVRNPNLGIPVNAPGYVHFGGAWAAAPFKFARAR